MDNKIQNNASQSVISSYIKYKITDSINKVCLNFKLIELGHTNALNMYAIFQSTKHDIIFPSLLSTYYDCYMIGLTMP